MIQVAKIVLALAGVPETLVADIEKEIPGAGRLIAAAKQVQPDVLQLVGIWELAAPHVTALAPLVEKGIPIVNRLTPVLKAEAGDLAELWPLAQRIMAFADGKKTA